MQPFVLSASLTLTLFATAANAQQQFMELARMELPMDVDSSFDVVAGDVDGDGDMDVVFGNNGQNTIYINDGLGKFTNETGTRFPSRALNTREVLLVDMDNDRDLDLWFANQGQNRLMLNDGQGVFTIAPLPRYRVWNEDFAVADVDGDNDLDVYWGEQGNGAATSQNRLWLNDGSLGFTDVTATHLPAVVDGTTGVEMGDIDNDGDVDIVVANGVSSEQDRLYTNDGTGRFTDATANLPQRQTFTINVLLEDLDLDNDLDILFMGDNGIVTLLRNEGNLSFTDISSGVQTTGGTFYDAATLDADGDGDKDLMIAEFFGSENRLYLNDGSLGFRPTPVSRTSPERQDSAAIVLVDVDSDKDADLLVANDMTQNRLDVNLHRQVHTPLQPQIGTMYQIDVYAQAGFIATNQPAAVWLSFQRIPPVAFPDWGTLQIFLPTAVQLPALTIMPPTGLATINLPIVNDPNLSNLPIFLQGGVVHSNNPVDWRFTNLVADTIQ